MNYRGTCGHPALHREWEFQGSSARGWIVALAPRRVRTHVLRRVPARARELMRNAYTCISMVMFCPNVFNQIADSDR
jgi:hypothetical protein